MSFNNLFKRTGIISVMAAIAIAAGIIMQSCSDDEFSSPVGTEEDKYSNWMEELNYVVYGEGSELLKDQGLTLVSYRLIDGLFLSENSVMSEGIKENALVPVYNDSINYNNFQLRVFSDLETSQREIYLQYKKQLIEDSKDADFKVIELTWKSKEGLFVSQCNVSSHSNRVVYDDILSNISYITVTEPENTGVVQTPRLKSGTESDGTAITHVLTTSKLQEEALIGNKIKAEAYCTITVNGMMNDSKKSIISHSEVGTYWFDAGFSADAKIEVTSFKGGTDGYCDFKYAITVGRKSGLTIGWSGTSFTLPAGGKGENGGGRIVPSNLQ